jgi:hypothetical protein
MMTFSQSAAPASGALGSIEVQLVPNVSTTSSAYSLRTAPDWTAAALALIKRGFLLTENWDGQGSPPATVRAANAAASVCGTLSGDAVPRPSYIGVTTEGGYIFEWGENLMGLVIEVDADGMQDGWYRSPEGRYTEPNLMARS